MRRVALALTWFSGSFALLVLTGSAPAGADETKAESAGASAAVERGLDFLAKDAIAWREKHKCVSCHHASMIVWSMREAKDRGHAVDETVLAELTKWMVDSGDGKVGVERPAGKPKAFNTKAVYFALALSSDPKPDGASQDGLKRMRKTVVDDQAENGSWVAWSETRPPFFGPSDETATALATLALVSGAADEAVRKSLDGGAKWLTEAKSDDDPQSAALKLILWKRLGKPEEECQPLVKRIVERQNGDGGWSQTKEMASDAWATGQALYALASAGLKSDHTALARGRSFLVTSQKEDGSWAMTSRPSKPGGEGAKNLTPITGGGSSWAVLGLVRSSPVSRAERG